MNKKLFKGALILFASILMAVSCKSNSNPDGGDTTTQQPGGGDKQETVTLTYADFLKKLGALTFGTDAVSDTGTFALSTILGIKAQTGEAWAQADTSSGNKVTITGQGETATSTSVPKFNTALRTALNTLAEHGYKVTFTDIAWGGNIQSSPTEATEIEFTVEPVEATAKTKYVFEQALSSVLPNSKLKITFAPKTKWAEN